MIAAILVLFLCGCFAKPLDDYQVKYFTQEIDHFNYYNGVGQFQGRYLISDKYWARGVGPVLFYCGNEGSIVQFYENTGFVIELAQKLNGLVVFAEHRFYGESLPFGKESFTAENMGYLTIEQALADYAVLIDSLKTNLTIQHVPVFAFGGSYGGILSGYMRYKYPHIISGSVASSAPFLTLVGLRPRSEFWNTTTETFRKAYPLCPGMVQLAFSQVIDLFSRGHLDVLEDTFNICHGQLYKEDAETHMLSWARNAFTLLSMMDYPYPAHFMVDLPGHPVNRACEMITVPTKVIGLANIMDLLYGKPAKCHDIYSEYVACADPTGCGTGADSYPWDYQACTEMVLPGGSNNVTDMFPPLKFTLEQREQYCSKWNVATPQRPTWLGVQYWRSLDDIKKASRIIFPNGDLDPWHTGGVLEDLSDSLIAIMVKGGAHHLDLRSSNPADPQSVIDARERITEIIIHWMQNEE